MTSAVPLDDGAITEAHGAALLDAGALPGTVVEAATANGRGRPVGELRLLLLTLLEDRELCMRDMSLLTGYRVQEVNRVLFRLLGCKDVECVGYEPRPWSKRPVAVYAKRRHPADAHALLRAATMAWGRTARN